MVSRSTADSVPGWGAPPAPRAATPLCVGNDDVSITGVGAASVFDVLRRRLASGSRDDGHRLGLVVEGGAMRGVYTAGALLALHTMGLSTLFDDVFGTSAGAVNAAHFLSGSEHLEVDTYYRVLSDGRFFKLRRWSKMVDIDFVADEVLTRLRPVNERAVLSSPTRLWVAVADYVKARGELYCAQTCGFPLVTLLKAAVALPVYYNELVPLGPVQGFDAVFCNPFPLRDARARCSHVLVLMSRAADYQAPPVTRLDRLLFGLRFSHGKTALDRMLVDSRPLANTLRAEASGRAPTRPGAPAIASLAPVNGRVRRTTQAPGVLRAELLRMARGTLRAFGHDAERLEAWVRSGRI